MDQKFSLFTGTPPVSSISKPRVYTFLKEHNSWYIDVAEYLETGGDKEDLNMDSGADDILNFLARGKKKVIIRIDTEPFEGSETLEMESLCEIPKGGAYYMMHTCKGKTVKKRMWLRDITLFVFGDMPERIYVQALRQTADHKQ